MCGTLFRQIVLTFHLLLHLNGWSSKLTYRRFYYVIRFMFIWVVISVTHGLLIQFTHVFHVITYYVYVVCFYV